MRALVAGGLVSVVRVSSDTPEVNTTNNIVSTGIVVIAPHPTLTVSVSAPARVLAGSPLSYRVRAHVGSRSAAASVRICQRPPRGLLVVSANPATFRHGGDICHDVAKIPRNGSAGFTVNAVAAAGMSGRTIVLPAQASAPGAATARGHDTVAVIGGGFRGNG